MKNPSCCRVEDFVSISSLTKCVYIYVCFFGLLIYVCVWSQLWSIFFLFFGFGVFVLVGGVVFFFFYAWVCVPSFWREVRGSVRDDNAELGCNRRKKKKRKNAGATRVDDDVNAPLLP